MFAVEMPSHTMLSQKIYQGRAPIIALRIHILLLQRPQKQEDKVCKYWMSGHCARGNKCWYLHSWCRGDGFMMLAKLEGHKKVIMVRNLGYIQNKESYIILSNISCFSKLQAVHGIALPLGSEKLYSGSGDGTLRTWDCHSGHCAHLSNLGDEVSSMITEGLWVFVGMKGVIKAWNTQTAQEFSLKGPVGHVHSMVVSDNMLFAGAQDGFTFAWKSSSEAANPFQLIASMEGHSGAVLCLAVRDKKLYSGSVDHTIRVWDTDTLQCIKTLNGHEDAVTSLLHCNGCLFSCSLDCSIKVWFATEGENWEVIYTHKEENGMLALCGMNDAETKPVLFRSCNDDTVRLYDLPSFTERGRLYSEREVRVIHRGPFPLFFTGDGTGSVTVWKWL
ncbi:Zinc finger WD40 repeat protein 1, putative isoform 3 [Theobroma cacao]|uniref:Zinc finger WD40 repeat protein 1, putative isoform 3 n=1 Tax=Theobroma cacao TaxID=3641 RepID=A0A061DRX7_THECC|nr:Zinc finger WD40 repeat protein 1, putative isoform 3 [Theobroma cacao]